MDEVKRLAAMKVLIKELIEGEYVREDGWQPNYIITQDGNMASRVNLIATVVSKNEEETFRNIILDDGTGTIPVRSFSEQDPFRGVDVGDVALVIGKIREYGAEKYLMPEIVRTINDLKWAELRKLEVKLRYAKKKEPEKLPEKIGQISGQTIGQTMAKSDEKPALTSSFKEVYSLIKSMDSGKGVAVEELSAKSNNPEIDKIVKALMEAGEIFEIRPGLVKVLE